MSSSVGARGQAGFWLVILATGCGEADGVAIPEIGSDPQIVNGQFNSGDPAVVALTVQGQHFCTGTLIRPTVVLTAAHCLPPHTASFGLTSYSQIDVYFGSDVSGGGQFVDVVAGWTHPGWNDFTIEDDIGLVRLASAGPATPIPFREQPMSPSEIGDPVRIIGFGITSQQSPGSSGIKRQATTQLSDIYQYVFVMNIAPSGTCNGDSGGTALMNLGGIEYVAGIHSRSDCISQSIDTRVDDYLDAIYAFIGETPGASCSADGQCASGCPAPDPDCPCAQDGFCDGSCPDPASDPDCGTSCQEDGFCDPSCASDPDCPPSCLADGECVAACGDSDPDCAPISCPADGLCDDSCPGLDPDCWQAGVGSDGYEGTVQVGGCATSSGRPPKPGWLALVGLMLLARRRRPAA